MAYANICYITGWLHGSDEKTYYRYKNNDGHPEWFSERPCHPSQCWSQEDANTEMGRLYCPVMLTLFTEPIRDAYLYDTRAAASAIPEPLRYCYQDDWHTHPPTFDQCMSYDNALVALKVVREELESNAIVIMQRNVDVPYGETDAANQHNAKEPETMDQSRTIFIVDNTDLTIDYSGMRPDIKFERVEVKLSMCNDQLCVDATHYFEGQAKGTNLIHATGDLPEVAKPRTVSFVPLSLIIRETERRRSYMNRHLIMGGPGHAHSLMPWEDLQKHLIGHQIAYTPPPEGVTLIDVRENR
jgi:hypothetical protein